MFEKPLDFLAIGDITTDAFIRLKEAHVNCRIDNTACELCLKFADKVPFESVTVVKAVGNSPNAAVAAARLGLNSGLITDIGSDQNGTDCLANLKKEGVATNFVARHEGIETNYHYVLWYGAERTILVNHKEFPYLLPRISIAPKWIYLSSIGGGGQSEKYHEEIAAYLLAHPQIKLAFQPGTFQMKLGTDKLATIYKRTEVFICNVEEAERITGLSAGSDRKDIKKLFAAIHALGPKIVHITDGPKGAYCSDRTSGKALATSNGNGHVWFMPIYPDPKPPLERTGCGDAYASTFVSALILGKSVEEALIWAPINPMWVVQFVGAQEGLLTRAGLESWLSHAPLDYKPVKL